MQVRDVKTDKVFTVSPTEDRVFVVTTDGVKVKLHPVVIKNMVKKGRRFDGQTQLGPRPMIREK